MSCRLASRSLWSGAFLAGVATTVGSACDSAKMTVTPGSGGSTGGTGATTAATDAPVADGVPGRADLPAPGSGGVGAAVGGASGGTSGAGIDGSITSVLGGVGGVGGGMGGAGDLDAAIPPPTGGTGGASDAAAGGSGGAGGSSDATTADGLGTGGTTADPCNPPVPSGHHTIHFRYPWAGQRTHTLFPRPEFMPKSVELRVTAFSNTLTCSREQDRPWFNCLVPDSYFVSGRKATTRTP